MDYFSINRVILLGNLGKDAELKYTPNGFAICNFSLATTERLKQQDGKQEDRTEWHRCVLTGKKAEALSQYLKKGNKIYIEGKIHTREWQDKEGNRRYSTEIRVENLTFFSGKSSDSSNAPESYQDYEAYAGSGKKNSVAQKAEEPSEYTSEYLDGDPDSIQEMPNIKSTDDDLPF